MRLGILAIAFVASTSAGAQTTYRRAVIDTPAQLRLITSGGQAILPMKDSGQVGFDSPSISADHRSVGWLALYPNCCTTYAIPLKLVVRTGTNDRVFEGSGLPIWRWAFVDNSKAVAFRQAPIHGDVPAHYELRDLATGKLVASFEKAVDSSRSAPRWVQIVDRKSP